MKVNRICLEAIALTTAIACACALLIATLAAVTVAFTKSASAEVSQAAETTQTVPAVQSRTFEGMITCSRCGAKHSAALGKAASDCTRQCVHSGAAFALVDGERTYELNGDAVALKKVAGQRARLEGAIRGNTIQVASVTAAN